MMNDLAQTYLDVYKKFEEGYFVVWRSDTFWAGLSTDLITEQVLIRSLKIRGGLTQGIGMSETYCFLWVLAIQACANINEAIQNPTVVTFGTSEQHKEVSTAWQIRDVSETLDIISFLQ